MAGQDRIRIGAIVERYLLEEAREVKSRERQKKCSGAPPYMTEGASP